MYFGKKKHHVEILIKQAIGYLHSLIIYIIRPT